MIASVPREPSDINSMLKNSGLPGTIVIQNDPDPILLHHLLGAVNEAKLGVLNAHT